MRREVEPLLQEVLEHAGPRVAGAHSRTAVRWPFLSLPQSRCSPSGLFQPISTLSGNNWLLRTTSIRPIAITMPHKLVPEGSVL